MPSPFLESQAFVGGIVFGAVLVAVMWAAGLFKKED